MVTPLQHNNINEENISKGRSIHSKLLQNSLLIDLEDAVLPKSRRGFNGWEPVRDIFVSRDEPLLVFQTVIKDSRQIRKKEVVSKDENNNGDGASSGSDNEDERSSETQIATTHERQDKKIERKKIKRPSSSRTLPLHAQLSQSPTPLSPLQSPTSPSLHSPINSHYQKTEDEGKKDFLPKIDPKHTPQYKKAPPLSAREPMIVQNSTITTSPLPVKLQMYSTEPPQKSTTFPLTSPASPSPPPSYSPTLASHQTDTYTPPLKKLAPDFNPPTRLQMYYPSSTKLYTKKL